LELEANIANATARQMNQIKCKRETIRTW